jgi:hypothetical protein
VRNASVTWRGGGRTRIVCPKAKAAGSISMNVNATLVERGKRYGEFAGHAEITERLKDAMREHPDWQRLASDQRDGAGA